MHKISLRILDLRKKRGISQQKLADALGVSFQAISKWETGQTMPDITMLPWIAEYFEVSVDQLLGLGPLPQEEYIPAESGTREYWGKRKDYLMRTRKHMWNTDYLRFLIAEVWKINKPVKVLDCGCGWGFLASVLLPLLPGGSTYTGIDFTEELIREGKGIFEGQERIKLICDDFIQYKSDMNYDLVISHMVLRHLNRPWEFLEKMISHCRAGGLVVCADVNRELESDGLYISGMDYSYLCSRPGFEKMWAVEQEKQGRDYSAAVKVPSMMAAAGLHDVECRMNDRVDFLSPQRKDYDEALEDMKIAYGWESPCIQTGDGSSTKINGYSRNADDEEEEFRVMRGFMNHGMEYAQARAYCRKQKDIAEHIEKNPGIVSVVRAGGIMFSYGRK